MFSLIKIHAFILLRVNHFVIYSEFVDEFENDDYNNAYYNVTGKRKVKGEGFQFHSEILG